jgi:hypothetical protein
METNVGTADRLIRIAAGLALISLTFTGWWGLAGLVPLVTGVLGWCPLYQPFGIDTSRTGRRAGAQP